MRKIKTALCAGLFAAIISFVPGNTRATCTLDESASYGHCVALYDGLGHLIDYRCDQGSGDATNRCNH